MAKQTLTERFQQLAGIKPLYELEPIKEGFFDFFKKKHDSSTPKKREIQDFGDYENDNSLLVRSLGAKYEDDVVQFKSKSQVELAVANWDYWNRRQWDGDGTVGFNPNTLQDFNNSKDELEKSFASMVYSSWESANFTSDGNTSLDSWIDNIGVQSGFISSEINEPYWEDSESEYYE